MKSLDYNTFYNKSQTYEGAYYLSSDPKNVMYTLRYVYRHYGGYRKNIGIAILAHNYNDALNKINKEWGSDFEVCISGIPKELNKRSDKIEYSKNFIPFGKYIGGTIGWVQKNDPEYLVWCGINYSNNPYVKSIILPLIQGR